MYYTTRAAAGHQDVTHELGIRLAFATRLDTSVFAQAHLSKPTPT